MIRTFRRRHVPGPLVVVLLLAVGARPGLAAPPTLDEARVRSLHGDVLTIDAHIDVRDDFNTPGNDPAGETADQLDLPKLERGMLDVAVVALFADPRRRTPENVAAARQQVDTKLDALRRFVAAHPERLVFANSSADLESAAASGKHAILLGFLNALALGEDLSLLRHYHASGVQVLGLAHAGNNAFADSSRPHPGFGDRPDEGGGLTALGRAAVSELNRLGVVIDVSQLSTQALLQTMELSRAPVIASHSALRSRVDVPRNLRDEELRAIAAQGGVVHVVAFANYLRQSAEFQADYTSRVWAPFGLRPGLDDPRTKLDAETYRKHRAAYREFSRNEWRYATLADYVDAIEAAVRLIGIDHVGISSDFNNGGGVTGFSHVGEAPNLTRELLKRGYGEAEIRKLWGGNFLRVFRAAEATARQLRSGEGAGAPSVPSAREM